MALFQTLRSSRPVRVLFIVQLALLVIFLIGLTLLWRALPPEGVKLHANVDTGVDLVGTRQDLSWIGVLGVAIVIVNMALSGMIAPRERTAALFLLGATIPVQLLLIGSMIFLAHLNRL